MSDITSDRILALNYNSLILLLLFEQHDLRRVVAETADHIRNVQRGFLIWLAVIKYFELANVFLSGFEFCRNRVQIIRALLSGGLAP